MIQTLDNTANILKALGDPTRLKIIKLLHTKGCNLCVGMIAGMVGVSQPAVSQHLKVLKNAGLVESERMGFHIHYCLVFQPLKKLGINLESLLSNLEVQYVDNRPCKHEK
ncbi:MAG: metalloregulator ArsR/SmtB family transcription factor [Spirochaetes bacterium]|nr:metalloregulator ArsR/SmtB family transcription factor [Spirochaetota bacterium]